MVSQWSPGSVVKLLVWDATCLDTFSPSYISAATRRAGAVAALVEERKEAKYTSLGSIHTFTHVHVAIETSGVFGPKSLKFVWSLGRRLEHVTEEERSTNYLMQTL